MSIISVRSNVTASCMLLVIFSVTLFLINFNFIMSVAYCYLSNTFTIAIPDISSTNGAITMTNFCFFDLISVLSSGKKEIDLFRKLKQESCESITPSSSNMFLIPKTKSIFSWISETKVKMSNLWPCMFTITGITNSTPTYCAFPA